jgi:SAM-dependent methyltransferase
MIISWSKGPADQNMPEQILTQTLESVRRHPWWHARAKLAMAVLRQHGLAPPAVVLDVGCGWGVNLDALESAGYTATGLDISRQILERIDHPGRHLIEADLNQPLPAQGQGAEAALVLDVIEHVDDDTAFLRCCAQLLRPGGLALVSVPARPDLFSEFDSVQGHRRRYLPDRLKLAFVGTGLDVQKLLWWGEWMVPLLNRRRKTNRQNGADPAKTYADYLRLPPWPAPCLMKLIYAWEQPRALKGKLHTGTSLFAIAVRQTQASN